MSSDSDFVSEQKGLISDELNWSILDVFLWGIYTVVYTGTLYLYLTKKSSKNKFIIWAISLSYWAYSAMAIISWYRNQSAVVSHSETQDTIFSALWLGPQWPALVMDAMEFVMAAVADGILIWRCYHVYGHSFRVLLALGSLLFCEIVIDLVALSWSAVYLEPSDSQAHIHNHLIAAQAFITAFTTLSSTALIAYRIYTTSTGDIHRNSKRLLMRLLEILGQSAAVYSLVAVADAICSIIPPTETNLVSWTAAEGYISVLFLFISGVSPTVLVARVAILDENDVYASSDATVSAPLSGLQFHVQSTQGDTESQLQFSERDSGKVRSYTDSEDKRRLGE